MDSSANSADKIEAFYMFLRSVQMFTFDFSNTKSFLIF